jgi:hypothetical protein
MARLCLDCEEVHDAQQCPTCASETFAYITRWVPSPERRQRPRTTAAVPTDRETVNTYRAMLTPEETGGWKMLRRGAVGLAIFGVAGWLWRKNSRQGAETTGSGPATGGTRSERGS